MMKVNCSGRVEGTVDVFDGVERGGGLFGTDEVSSFASVDAAAVVAESNSIDSTSSM